MDTVWYGDGDGAVARCWLRVSIGVGEWSEEGLVGQYGGTASESEGRNSCVCGGGIGKYNVPLIPHTHTHTHTHTRSGMLQNHFCSFWPHCFSTNVGLSGRLLVPNLVDFSQLLWVNELDQIWSLYPCPCPCPCPSVPAFTSLSLLSVPLVEKGYDQRDQMVLWPTWYYMHHLRYRNNLGWNAVVRGYSAHLRVFDVPSLVVPQLLVQVHRNCQLPLPQWSHSVSRASGMWAPDSWHGRILLVC